MILDNINRLAEQGAARYGLLTESWRGLYHKALNHSNFGSFAVSVDIARQARDMAESFMRDEEFLIGEAIDAVAGEALQTTFREIASASAPEHSERALEHLRAIEGYLYSEVLAQLQRDIALVSNTIQRVVLEVSIAARARNISERTALIAYRIDNQADIQFTFHDRRSRQWSAKKFIRAIWRHTLLAGYNEAVLHVLADHGLTRAQIKHQNGKADVHGRLISIGSDYGLPSYSEIRNEVFHPNANCVLCMEAADVSI